MKTSSTEIYTNVSTTEDDILKHIIEDGEVSFHHTLDAFIEASPDVDPVTFKVSLSVEKIGEDVEKEKE